ncbi:MAG: ribosome maturation factor RimP [Candidatus Omnitrophica bacterium]|nr:ribosome maturation factor RimP [Candidatus Omnitrophota bacterium]
MNKEILSQLKPLLEEFLNQEGFILVDVDFVYEASRLILRILTDHRYGGINLEECSQLNQKIGRLLDEKDLIKTSYVLEVSSPGLDRPLKTEEDFIRCINQEVILYTNQPIKGKKENCGFIREVVAGGLLFEIEGETINIPFDYIIKAKQIISI